MRVFTKHIKEEENNKPMIYRNKKDIGFYNNSKVVFDNFTGLGESDINKITEIDPEQTISFFVRINGKYFKVEVLTNIISNVNDILCINNAMDCNTVLCKKGSKLAFLRIRTNGFECETHLTESSINYNTNNKYLISQNHLFVITSNKIIIYDIYSLIELHNIETGGRILYTNVSDDGMLYSYIKGYNFIIKHFDEDISEMDFSETSPVQLNIPTLNDDFKLYISPSGLVKYKIYDNWYIMDVYDTINFNNEVENEITDYKTSTNFSFVFENSDKCDLTPINTDFDGELLSLYIKGVPPDSNVINASLNYFNNTSGIITNKNIIFVKNVLNKDIMVRVNVNGNTENEITVEPNEFKVINLGLMNNYDPNENKIKIYNMNSGEKVRLLLWEIFT